MKLHYIGSFFRISFSRKRNARKEKGLTPFSRKGGKPPKRGLVQPRSSPSWVRAPTAKPSEGRQDGDAGLASPLGGGGICKANAGEGLRGMGILLRDCFAESLGIYRERSCSFPKQNSTLFRFRPTSPIRLAKQFCPAA